jgi:hypothetical protein
MSTVRKEPPIELPPTARSKDDFDEDLERLEQRLAESRAAILSTEPAVDAQRAGGRRDDVARELELLVQRLAQ